MPSVYAALPSRDHYDLDNTRQDESSYSLLLNDHDQFRIQASDDEDEDEEHGPDNTSDSHPLNPSRGQNTTTPDVAAVITYPPTSTSNNRRVSYDYTYPPPGSPPPVPRGDRAIPDNGLGNSNGIIPDPARASPSSVAGPSRPRPRPTSGWLARAAGAILPTHYAQRVAGGTPNDGVFSNVTAKPTVQRQVTDGKHLLHFRYYC